MDKLDLIVDKIENLRGNAEKALDKVNDSVENIHGELTDIKYQVRRNADDLQEHMKRTELNEKRVELIEERFSIDYLLKLIFATITGLSTVAAGIYGIIRIIEYFQG